MPQYLVEEVHYRHGDEDSRSRYLIEAADANTAVYECIKRQRLQYDKPMEAYNPNRQYASAYTEFYGRDATWCGTYEAAELQSDGSFTEVSWKLEPDDPAMEVGGIKYYWIRNQEPRRGYESTEPYAFGPPALISILDAEERTAAEKKLHEDGIWGLYVDLT